MPKRQPCLKTCATSIIHCSAAATSVHLYQCLIQKTVWGATRGRHHLGIPSNFIQPAPKTCRPIRRSSAPGRTQIQGAHIPRTPPFQTVQARGSRWSPQATTFLRLLAHTKARAVPNILRKAVEASLLSRWSAILTHAAQHAFAASLLDLDCAGTSTTDGDTPSPSASFCQKRPFPA